MFGLQVRSFDLEPFLASGWLLLRGLVYAERRPLPLCQHGFHACPHTLLLHTQPTSFATASSQSVPPGHKSPFHSMRQCPLKSLSPASASLPGLFLSTKTGHRGCCPCFVWLTLPPDPPYVTQRTLACWELCVCFPLAESSLLCWSHWT